MNDEEFFDKVEWEGGLYEALIGYGISPNDVLNPEIADFITRFREANLELGKEWSALYKKFSQY